ncbi:alpha-1,2-fucosyltransferase [Polynucleobacter necessarius]|uniref:alpha-1,2-fucosyltransferase n=1 Tax=Polynucleobacter necessarius TaxID=576610 RepID=UPI001E54B8CB|nr:alpha-1,2-fucosyltransferase [Polynucleobacter necessarius]
MPPVDPLRLSGSANLKLIYLIFVGYWLHQGFELEKVFNCQINLATNKDLINMLGFQGYQNIRTLLSRASFSWLRVNEFIVEPHFEYWPELSSSPKNSYIRGYWQSDKYFLDVANELRADFAFKNPMTSVNLELAKKIEGENSVSLHIRRGDYVQNPKANAVHGTCTLNYYSEAIRLMMDEVGKPHIFIFSDEIDLVRKNLSIPTPHTFVYQNIGADSDRDMQLMSICKHNIIANSSFSWCGTWLNAHSNKVVISPKQWFHNGNDIKDLIPSQWRSI